MAFVDHWLKEANYAWEVGSFRKEFWDIKAQEWKVLRDVHSARGQAFLLRARKTKPVQTIEAAWTDDAALVMERKADGWRMRGFYAIDELPRGE